ncbi:alpha/beta hydrolase family protein [Flavobacterium johnsoniae]|uniref:alpha/beta hydrolase family protein n=1 Tax=Flavobacterium johnsoniae TaxID=986 RepID=UPI003D97AB4C
MFKNNIAELTRIKKTAVLQIRILFVFFILPLVACPLWGQVVQKKQLTKNDYHLWGEMKIDKVSPDSNWITYNVTYENGTDTLFLRSSVSKKTYRFPSGRKTSFAKNILFLCTVKNDLQLLDLKTGNCQVIRSVVKFSFSQKTNQLIVLLRLENGKTALLIRTLKGKIIKEIQNTDDFTLSPDDSSILYSTSSELGEKKHLLFLNLNLLNAKNQFITESRNTFSGFTWDKKGKSFAFITLSNNTTADSLFYYSFENKTLYKINHNAFFSPYSQGYICSDNALKLLISDDRQRVFFDYKIKDEKSNPNELTNVEIWNSDDKWVYLQQQREGTDYDIPKTAVWNPFNNTVSAINSNDLPKLILSGNQKAALLSSPKEYEPQYELQGPRDYYLLDLITFKKKLLLKKQSSYHGNIIPSPNGNFIAYFKENNWWVYNILKNVHVNITKKIKGEFSAELPLYASESVYGNPGWNSTNNEIILYDKHDIWLCKTDGTSFRRITNGKESKIKFRLADIPGIRTRRSFYDAPEISTFNMNSTVYLSAAGDDGKTGFFKWNPKSGLTVIVYEDSFIDQLNYSSDKNLYFYRKQNFNIPPQIEIAQNKQKNKTLFQSNPQHFNYYWGHSEMLNYQNSSGQNLKGVLCYPANYDPKKKYPMIVNIYQTQNRKIHYYKNPSLNNGNGFNVSVYTQQGYFVLLPDIVSTNQNPALAALDCVTASINKVLEKEIVNRSKIGLMGHSFGGFETSFIITRSNLFAAASVGAGITDLKSFYLTENQNSGRPNMWFLENGQWKMRDNLFENKDLYENNSPMTEVSKIKIPLLIWTGKEDEQVDPHQSMELYLALRRLGKKSTMLVYPNEGHDLLNSANQQDLTNRILEWFNYYLKDDLNAQSIEKG